MTEWHRVVFSDESRFCLSSDSRRVRVWRRRGERSNPTAIVERPTVRQRGIMVWRAIAYDSRLPLLRIQGTMTAQRYVDDVLRPVTLPYLQGVPNALYQQDNARPHTARISQQALQDVQMLPWPPYSPDLSPIEHVWDIIGRRLHALPQPRSEDELWQMVEREWRAIPQDAIRTLIDSLPRRVAACIAVRGLSSSIDFVLNRHDIIVLRTSDIVNNLSKISPAYWTGVCLLRPCLETVQVELVHAVSGMAEVILADGVQAYGAILCFRHQKRERAKMEEPTRHSNETTKQSLPQQETIFQEQAVNTPTTQPKIPQNKPVRSSPPSALQRNHLPGISKSIEKFVRSCHTCQIIKRPKGKPYGALGQIPPPQQPFDLIFIDTIEEFSKYGHSKTYLHVIVDHLTRYAWTFPSKSTSTLTYIQALKTVLQQGFPKRLLSDRAPPFTSEKLRIFLITHGIQPLLTTSNNPQANGLIERLNATITGNLRLAYLENPKASWTQLVKRVTQTYNNKPHSVKSFPPTYLMLNVVPPDLRTHLNPYPEITRAREIARSRTQNKHKKDKETFDKQHRTPHFEVNDLVLVKNYRHPDTGKLAPYFTGPYTIIEIISPNVVRIDRPNQPLNRDSDTIHVNKLKYYTENVLYITPPQTRFIQNPQRMSQDVYLSEFKHLTPDIFETQLFRIIPSQTSQPFLHLNPDLFNIDRFKTNLK
ncbi:hypothetical protein LAZ67_18001328 [Cordylochernes scorpioides]|uniref:Integrase catalytic domain-containing protein n=1 Tax=Cordylochernes scorpioides TaxID=51811 RepID=A0ABY6LHT1_9ARAC|nr:hypothetical protein LAZ67_18001328 [Cordylochernes scorpioides]